jgi:ribonuclease E
MTRKRVGEGLIEAFSETCEVCHGRGIIVHPEPVEKSGTGAAEDDEPKKSTSRRKRGGKSGETAETAEEAPPVSSEQRTKALAAMTAIHRAAHPDDELLDGDAAAAAELELEAVTAVLAGSEFDLAELTDRAAPSGENDADAEADEPEAAVLVAEAVTEPVTEPVTESANTTPNGAAAPSTPSRRPRRRRAASRPAGPPSAGS